MKKLFLIIALVSCTSPDCTREVLLDQGYTDIRVGGHAYFMCSEDDTYCTEFEATGPSGRRVSGAVGCGLRGYKGCTVRVGR